MASGQAPRTYDRVVERRRAVALARHFREAEGLSIAQIAARLGRSPATVKSYFYDPTGEKTRGTRRSNGCARCGSRPLPSKRVRRARIGSGRGFMRLLQGQKASWKLSTWHGGRTR